MAPSRPTVKASMPEMQCGPGLTAELVAADGSQQPSQQKSGHEGTA
jgi:hypothetical protein